MTSIERQIELHDEIIQAAKEEWDESSGARKEKYRKKIDKALDLRLELMKKRDENVS